MATSDRSSGGPTRRSSSTGRRPSSSSPDRFSKDDGIVAEDVAVTERRGGKPTKVLNRLGARYVADFKEQAPVNTLDIVHLGKPGLVKVFYQGEPLAKAKRDFKTDELGAFEASLPGAAAKSSRSRTPTPPGASWARRPMTRRARPARSSCASGDGIQGPPQPPVTTPKR